MSIRGRISALEGRDGPGCRECTLKPQRNYVFYPQEGDHTPEPERCPSCDRPLGFVIKVVYEGEGEG